MLVGTLSPIGPANTSSCAISTSSRKLEVERFESLLKRGALWPFGAPFVLELLRRLPLPIGIPFELSIMVY
jgi:hypothetical protein